MKKFTKCLSYLLILLTGVMTLCSFKKEEIKQENFDNIETFTYQTFIFSNGTHVAKTDRPYK